MNFHGCKHITKLQEYKLFLHFPYYWLVFEDLGDIATEP